MQTIRSLRALASWRRALLREGVTVGLVPTMGALHEGHLSLIRQARLSCDAVVVSLFVNPRQFGPREDYARYPRTFKADARLCREAGVDLLFAPSAAAVYPPGFQTTVSAGPLGERWEGAIRPGHFDGVATVVAKLFALVRPDVAFFGQKDFQQAAIIRRLAEDLNCGLRIVVCPTVRESDGLALSSRNRYLTPAQRRVAPVLHRALRAGLAAIRGGRRRGSEVVRAMQRVVEREKGVTVDYLALCDPATLAPLPRVGKAAVLLGAIRLGQIRLIDNILISNAER